MRKVGLLGLVPSMSTLPPEVPLPVRSVRRWITPPVVVATVQGCFMMVAVWIMGIITDHAVDKIGEKCLLVVDKLGEKSLVVVDKLAENSLMVVDKVAENSLMVVDKVAEWHRTA